MDRAACILEENGYALYKKNEKDRDYEQRVFALDLLMKRDR